MFSGGGSSVQLKVKDKIPKETFSILTDLQVCDGFIYKFCYQEKSLKQQTCKLWIPVEVKPGMIAHDTFNNYMQWKQSLELYRKIPTGKY